MFPRKLLGCWSRGKLISILDNLIINLTSMERKELSSKKGLRGQIKQSLFNADSIRFPYNPTELRKTD